MSNCMARLPVWSTKKKNVATELISYKRYGEILFQKAFDSVEHNAIWNALARLHRSFEEIVHLTGGQSGSGLADEQAVCPSEGDEAG